MTKACLWIVLFFVLPASGASSAQPIAIDFDLNGAAGVAARHGSGFLHSLSDVEPPSDFVDPLNIKLWRGACLLNDALYSRLQRSGATIQYVLSDGFQHPTQGPCDKQVDTGRFPHQYPALWKKHIEDDARRILAKGWHVVWEPWNEPDWWPGSFDPQKRDAAFDQYLDAFLVAYQIIKKLDPNARFSGPSLSADSQIGWDLSRNRIETFLKFCARHHIEVADLTWHGFDDKNIDAYPQRIREIRHLAATKYPSVKVQRVLISEIVSEGYFDSPGDMIAHLKYLDDADVDLVSNACWYDSCWEPSLAGSVVKDARGTFHKTPLWWANYWYASTVGSRYSGKSAHPGLAAEAVTNTENGSLSVLLGFSRAAGPMGAQSILLRLRGAAAYVKCKTHIERVSEQKTGFLDQPMRVQYFERNVQQSYTAITLKSVLPGDVYRISLNQCEL